MCGKAAARVEPDSGGDHDRADEANGDQRDRGNTFVAQAPTDHRVRTDREPGAERQPDAERCATDGLRAQARKTGDRHEGGEPERAEETGMDVSLRAAKGRARR